MALTKDTQAIIAKLQSEEEEKVLAGLALIKEKGNAEMVEPLLDLLLNDLVYTTELEVLDVLFGLKDSKGIARFLDLAFQSKYSSIEHKIFSIIWNANINANAHLALIVNKGIKGSMLTLIEAHTIVENIDGTLDEEQLLESISDCKKFLNEHIQHEKLPLVKDMLSNLLKLDNAHSDISNIAEEI